MFFPLNDRKAVFSIDVFHCIVFFISMEGVFFPPEDGKFRFNVREWKGGGDGRKGDKKGENVVNIRKERRKQWRRGVLDN